MKIKDLHRESTIIEQHIKVHFYKFIMEQINKLKKV